MVAETYCFCRRCASRVEIGRIPVGARLSCAKCGLEFTISCPAHDRGGAGEGESKSEEQRVLQALRRPPRAGLFFSGTFRFPFYRQTLQPLATLAIVTSAVVGATKLAIWCVLADNESVDRFTRILLWNGLLLATTFGSIVAMTWTFVASAYGLAILHETSDGSDVVENWPNLLALEELGGVGYVVSALLLSLLPGLLATPLWRWLEVPRPLMIFVGTPILFPVFLLSMLGTNSPMNPLASAVWRSLFPAWRAWGPFYLLTFAGIGTVAAILATVQRYSEGAIAIIASGVLIAVAWMIYFRLLGRLALFCAGNYGV
jgi:hypothetical protein